MNSLLPSQQINYFPRQHTQFNERDRLGYENALACLTNPESLTEPNEYGCEFIAKKINKVARNIYWELRSILYQSPEHSLRIAALEAEYNHPSRIFLFKDVTPFEQTCAIDDWFSRHIPLKENFTFFLSARLKRNDNFIYDHISANFKKSNSEIYSLMQLTLGNGRAAPLYDSYEKKTVYIKNPNKLDTFEKQDPWQNQYEKFIYPLEALEIVRQPKFIASTLLKGNAFEAELIDEDFRYGVILENGQIRPTTDVEIKGQRTLSWEESLVKNRSAARVIFELDKELHKKRLREEESDICSNTGYNSDQYNVNVRVTPRDILRKFRDTLTSDNKSLAENLLYELIFKLFVVKIGVQSTPNLHQYIITKLQNFEN